MKNWTTPMAMEECFTANVDVAVTTCYKIACDINAATAVEQQKYQYVLSVLRPHHNDYNCGDANNQTIQVDSSHGNEVIKMKAVHGGALGNLDSNCIFYDPDYQKQIDAKDVDITQTIYWETPGELRFPYHHQGTIDLNAVASKRSMS